MSEPKSKTSPMPVKRYGALLYRYLRPQWPKALLMSLLLLASIGLQLVVPQILRFFIDQAIAGGLLEVLLRAALLFFGVAFSNQLLAALATYFGADVGWTATNAMRADLTRHCLKLDMGFHNARTPGELIERIDGDVTALSNFFSQFVVRVLGGVLLLIGILVLLWLEHWLVGLILTIFVAIVSWILAYRREVAVPATHAEREANAKLFGFIEERLAGIEDIRANGGGVYTMRRFHGVMRQFFNSGLRAWLLRSTLWTFAIGLFGLGYVMTLGLGVYLFSLGAITLGTAYLFVQYMVMIETPLEQITQQMEELQKAAASIARVDELLRLNSKLPPGNSHRLKAGALAVSFERVSFAYDDKPVLDKVSFQLSPGQVLGLLGRTGSGKSTLTRLLFRLYDPSSGQVRLSGVDTRDADLALLRQHVGMVTQEVQLFHATVRDNLTFFDRSISDERIMAAFRQLGLDGWLERLPQGLDTMLLTGGGGLSGGEAQLLAFTRVFLKDPGLVILDEPSSRLDPATEALLERAVSKLLAGRTAIIIAHRLDTVRRADEIMIMSAGRVLEHGPRERLAQDPRSRFHRLLEVSHHPDADLSLQGELA